jgi:hypothetical protein
VRSLGLLKRLSHHDTGLRLAPDHPCITNWAKQGLPIHVVQQLPGHSDLKTTQEFYLSAGKDDVNKARLIQKAILGQLSAADPTDQLSDQLLNNRRQCVRAGFLSARPAQPSARTPGTNRRTDAIQMSLDQYSRTQAGCVPEPRKRASGAAKG